MKESRVLGIGCALLIYLVPPVWFGNVLLSVPIGLFLGREPLSSDDPIRRWSSLVALVYCLYYYWKLRLRPLPENSPYREIPQAGGATSILSELSASPATNQLLIEVDGPGETAMGCHSFGPLLSLGYLWISLVLGAETVSLAKKHYLISQVLSWPHFVVMLLYLIPGLTWFNRGWKLLEKRRKVDERLLFDFEQGQLSLVDLQQDHDRPIWTVPFKQASIELSHDDPRPQMDRPIRLILCVSGQEPPFVLDTWPRPRFCKDGKPCGEALARRTGMPLYEVFKAHLNYGNKPSEQEVPEQRTRIV